MTITCDKCHTTNASEAVYCMKCGVRLAREATYVPSQGLEDFSPVPGRNGAVSPASLQTRSTSNEHAEHLTNDAGSPTASPTSAESQTKSQSELSERAVPGNRATESSGSQRNSLASTSTRGGSAPGWTASQKAAAMLASILVFALLWIGYYSNPYRDWRNSDVVFGLPTIVFLALLLVYIGTRPSNQSKQQISTASDGRAVKKVTAAEELTGIVRTYRLRDEQTFDWRGRVNGHEQVITFRIERVNSRGDPLPPIPVEVRAKKISGFIDEGDEVTIPGPWYLGYVAHPKYVLNETTSTRLWAG